MAATDTTYNGWKNYPTWAVHLWLSNDEYHYNASVHYANLYPESRSKSADVLKSWVQDFLPDLGGTLAADLLGFAIDHVDWLEVADAFREDEVRESV